MKALEDMLVQVYAEYRDLDSLKRGHKNAVRVELESKYLGAPVKLLVRFDHLQNRSGDFWLVPQNDLTKVETSDILPS